MDIRMSLNVDHTIYTEKKIMETVKVGVKPKGKHTRQSKTKPTVILISFQRNCGIAFEMATIVFFGFLVLVPMKKNLILFMIK